LSSCRCGITSEVKRNTMPPIKAASPPAVSPQLQRQARPQIKAEPAESPQPTTSQPITPSKRRRQRIDSEDDFEPESPSPMKKARTPRRLPAGWATRSSAPGTPTRAPAPAPQTPTGTAPRTPGRIPGTPSQKALKDAKRAQEKEWEEDWYALVARSRWTQDKNFRHPKGTTTIYRSNGK
jgi:hypothetical protein